ncbi:MAG: LPS assembly protein LptD [Oceanicaulis sp.]
MVSASPIVLAQAGQPVSTTASRSDSVYMEADQLEERRGEGVYIARGAVRLTSGDRVIYADEITYNTLTGRVVARGHVRIYEGSQPAQFADEVELDDDIREGVAYGFATLLENNGRAAAASALRRPNGSVELTDAYYTACDLCEDGSREPSWRLRADRVVRDLDDGMIYYRDVRLEVAGVPVAYSPVFAHADPSQERKSGLLLPSLDISDRLGVVYQQPYLWVINPYQDLVIAPRIMTEANPLLELDYRKRFYSGMIDVETSFTYEQEFDQDGFFGPEQLRGHIFADGLFNISRDWRWGFGLQAASEDLYLRRYDYTEQPEETDALFQFDQARTLINQLFVAGKGDHYYTDVSVLAFDQLRDGFDDDRLPYMAPYWRFAADGELPMGLGDFDVFANSVNLRREQGDDYSRVSLGASWSRPVIAPGGVRLEPFATGRADAFRQTEAIAGAPDETRNFTRARGAAGLDVSYPFVRPGARFDVVIAPRTALIAANGGDPEERPLIQDAVSVDFDRSLLFQPVRAPGFDVFEDGVRVDAGFELDVRDRLDVFGLEAFLGRSYRLDGGDERFDPASGLFEEESDWVADLRTDLGPLYAEASTRIDTQTGDINRLDAGLGVDVWRVNAEIDYLNISDDAASADREEISWSADAGLTDTLSVFYSGRYDLSLNEDRIQEAGLMYQDECTVLRVYWERRNIKVGNLDASNSVKFEVVLFTLGGVAED